MVTQGELVGTSSNPSTPQEGVSSSPKPPAKVLCYPEHASDILNSARLFDGACPAGWKPVPGGNVLGPGSVPNPADVLKPLVKPFHSVTDFLNWLRDGITNRNFWKGVGLLFAGVAIIGVGIILLFRRQIEGAVETSAKAAA